MAGLQDMAPILVGSKLTSATRKPSRAPTRAAAQAASTPAWPPPTMMMSNPSGLRRP
jgi:hypothetical protein